MAVLTFIIYFTVLTLAYLNTNRLPHIKVRELETVRERFNDG